MDRRQFITAAGAVALIPLLPKVSVYAASGSVPTKHWAGPNCCSYGQSDGDWLKAMYRMYNDSDLPVDPNGFYFYQAANGKFAWQTYR